MDKLPFFSPKPHFLQSPKLMGTNLPSREFCDGEFQLTYSRSAKIIDKVVEEVQKCSILVP